MASLPSVPRPVYNELYDRNMTAWLLNTQQNIVQGTRRNYHSHDKNICWTVVTEPMALQERFVNYTQGLVTWLGEYVDIDFVIFLKWLMSPIIITFVILPL